ncbi:SpoIIE family protein phosphatase [Vicingus serpentipes]|uniref:SpoIIE family protein phosphatase n=1 Tax=Vicingus serpentipes TaxID=1926625 RepID=A0A5C6RV40_9FLAO|nr:SpoIIE family protein phosphatase [Vicingus serpentipes]TXB65845.1 SpoIIE family protein phosphatase [Vicingus serpentipes]
MRFYVAVEADFDESFTYLVHILKILENKEDHILYPLIIGDAYFIAYWINQIQYDLVKAEDYITKLIKHATKFDMKKLLIKAKMGDAELTQHKGNLEQAIKKFKAIEKDIISANDSIQLNRLYLLLSNSYTVKEDNDSAFVFARKAYDAVPTDNIQLKAFSTIHLARGYLKNNKIEQAIELGKEALNVVEDLEAKKEIKDINYFLAEAYKNNTNYKLALMHLEKYMELDKEQASLLSAANISNLEAQLSNERHGYELEIKQVELDKQELEIETKNKQSLILIVILILAAGFIIAIVRSYVLKKRDAEIIYQQKIIVEEKNREITDSIAYAKRIQSAILPPVKLVKEYLEESFILYKPKDVVAGDFYWMEHTNGKVLFAAADCTGHGVPGAMVSVVCNNALNRSVREYGLTDPGEILTKTREIVIQEFEKSEEDVKDGMDIALCSLKQEFSGWKLQYAGAHNPLWIIRNNEIIETKANKQPIGKFDNPEPYTTHIFDLQEGDTIYIFSDGYVDQFGGEKGKKFKAKAFRELLLGIQDKTMEQQKTIIDETFEEWRGAIEQIDDVCVIGVRI